MNHRLGHSSHLRLCAPRLCAPRLYTPAKSNPAYFYIGALSNPCLPCKARRLNAQKIIHQHPNKMRFISLAELLQFIYVLLCRDVIDRNYAQEFYC